MTSPLIGFSVAVSGMTMPPGDVRSSSRRLMTNIHFANLLNVSYEAGDESLPY
jgi:hypothetical protein